MPNVTQIIEIQLPHLIGENPNFPDVHIKTCLGKERLQNQNDRTILIVH